MDIKFLRGREGKTRKK